MDETKQTKQYVCSVCGGTFAGSGKRGRPHSKCESCRLKKALKEVLTPNFEGSVQ